MDKDELPKGNGRMTRMIQKVSQNERKNCFELLPTIESVHGRFVKGYPQGKATIRKVNTLSKSNLSFHSQCLSFGKS